MKQLVLASTFFQCLSLVAAVDAGALPDAAERILVLADGSQAPELTVPLAEQDGFDVVRSRFDRVVDLSELLYPRRPVQFAPRREEHLVWERLLRSHWRLGRGPLQLVLDFVQVNPGLSLAGVFADAELWTHSDGLMTYSPTRRTLPLSISQRLTGLVHLDLVPGLTPQMLAEHGVVHRTVGLPALGAVLDEVRRDAPSGAASDRATDVAEGRPTALVLGQYLSSLGLVTGAEETELSRSLVREAANRGAEVCVFKPHPAAPPAQAHALADAARQEGVELVIDPRPEAAELTMHRRRPTWVISCFSTGLSTAAYLLGLEAVAVGTSRLLSRLAPYENSNRVPLVLAEALFHRDDFRPPALAGPDPGSRDLQRLVEAVAYCMQPDLHPGSAARTAAYLGELESEPDLLALFFKRRRLTRLGLPGALPARGWSSRTRHRLARVRSQVSLGQPVSGRPSRRTSSSPAPSR
ncbi:alpha-2,8-polysialyltransferase family protein [Microlunatus aurantiacus]|uniref:Alpha-2,8-polysialyltransferase family protein n=1 Tax=Microlunatus aurantiacus TaxID=446786 RepID=A0ABP7EAS2_9ACTN